MNSAAPPLVSIITPSYNQGQFLEETIRSVLEQDYPNVEYIVIDGGSTDESVAIIGKYADRVSYWVSEPDRGQSHAINKGWERSHGSIVAWLNSDDAYRPSAISRAVEALLAHPEASMVCGNCDRIDARGNLLTTLRPQVGPVEGWVQGKCWAPQPAVFMRSEIVRRSGSLVAEDLHVVMDFDLWLRLAAEAPAVCLDGPALALDREYPERKTNAFYARRMDEYRTVLERFYRRYGDRPELRRVRRSAFAWVYFRLASAALSDGRAYPDGLRWLVRSLLLDPGPARHSWKHAGGIVKHGLRQLVFRPGKA